jgi:hypothetical protein
MGKRTLTLIGTAVASLVLLSACGAVKGKQTAENAVITFHQNLNDGQFAVIYAATHPDFQKNTSQKDFGELLGAIHKKLGAS